MGIWESLNDRTGRSAGSINDIADVIARVQKEKKIAENTQRLRDAMTKSNNGLAGMSNDDVFNMGNVLQETPELSQTVKLLQDAVEVRQPKRFNLSRGERQYSEDPLTHQITPGVENPFEFPPAKPVEIPEEKLKNAIEEYRQKLELEKKMGAGSFKPVREPIPSLETIRHNKATETAANAKAQTDLRLKDDERVKALTDKNKEYTINVLMMENAKDAKGNATYTPQNISQVKKMIQDNQDEIARIHLKNGGKYTTLRVAREHYKSIDPNAPELQMSDESMKAALEKAGYQVAD
jgi:hypothetical protein